MIGDSSLLVSYRTKFSCLRCKKLHKKCTGGIPCDQCKSRGLAKECCGQDTLVVERYSPSPTPDYRAVRTAPAIEESPEGKKDLPELLFADVSSESGGYESTFDSFCSTLQNFVGIPSADSTVAAPDVFQIMTTGNLLDMWTRTTIAERTMSMQNTSTPKSLTAFGSLFSAPSGQSSVSFVVRFPSSVRFLMNESWNTFSERDAFFADPFSSVSPLETMEHVTGRVKDGLLHCSAWDVSFLLSHEERLKVGEKIYEALNEKLSHATSTQSKEGWKEDIVIPGFWVQDSFGRMLLANITVVMSLAYVPAFSYIQLTLS
eukprot:TRINITY_DN48713_c0_g1_i1.p1 TRINITY_DN48713_c0_g1~~TRINITY_DN48713_c0_g1_i1.p1  ORF type:complete len:317 (-),score=43.48 TRINITY_DN48713_c0_g1_i1:857-1807(-)